MSLPTIAEDQFEFLSGVSPLESDYQTVQANSAAADAWLPRNSNSTDIHSIDSSNSTKSSNSTNSSNSTGKSPEEEQPTDLITFEELRYPIVDDDLRYKILHHLTDVSKHLNDDPTLARKNLDLANSLWNMQIAAKPDDGAAGSSATSDALQGDSNNEETPYRVTKSNLLNDVGRKKKVDLTDSRSEATFTLKIDRLSEFLAGAKERAGDIFYVRNLAWYITSEATRQSNGLIGISFFLFCEPNAPNFGHCQTRLCFRLLNQESDKCDYVRSLEWKFKPNSHCGFPAFIYDLEFVDELKGFVKHDSMYLEIAIEADEPTKLDRKPSSTSSKRTSKSTSK